MLSDERPHEEHQNNRAFARGHVIGPRSMPQATFEDQCRTSWAFGGKGSVDIERIIGRDMANVASGEDSRAAVLPRDIRQEPHDVETVADIPQWWLNGNLVCMKHHGHIPWPCDIGAVAVKKCVFAE